MQSNHKKIRFGRRHTALAALVASVVLGVTACGSSGNTNAGGTTGPGSSVPPTGTSTSARGGSCTPQPDKKLKLAFVYATSAFNPMQEMALGAQAAADEDGNVDLVKSAPPNPDDAKEVQLLQSAVQTSTDGIAFETLAPNLFPRVINQGTDAGIPMIAVDTPSPEGTKVKTFVGNSNYDIGFELGEEFIKQKPKEDGTVVLGIDIPTLIVLQNRMKGVEAAIKKDLPNMTIVGPLDVKNDLTQTYNAWSALVHKYTDAVGFIGVGSVDGTALPSLQKKLNKRFLAGSADVPPDALQAVKDGYLFALSSPEHWMKGYVALKLLIDHARKCTPIPEGWWNSGNLLLTKANIDDFIARQKSPQTRYEWFKQHDIPQQFANPPIKPISEAN